MHNSTEQEFWEYLGEMLDAAHGLLDQTKDDLLLAVAIEAVTVLETVTDATDALTVLENSNSDDYVEGMREGLSRAGLSLRALVQAYLSRQDDGPLTIGDLLNGQDNEAESV